MYHKVIKVKLAPAIKARALFRSSAVVPGCRSRHIRYWNHSIGLDGCNGLEQTIFVIIPLHALDEAHSFRKNH